MTLEKKYIIFFIPLIIFLNKWIISYLIFPNDFLITKILFDTPDIQYYAIIKSLAELDFYPSYHDKIQAENILTFPYGSIFLHSVFFKIFGYSSILLAEFIFIFLFFFVLYKILLHIGFTFSSAIVCAVFIIFIPTLFNLLSNFEIPYINELSTTTNYIFSSRFPRPQVSGFYYLAFIYLTLKFSNDIEENSKNNVYAIYFGLILGLILNSFFYFFIYCSLAIFLMLLINYKQNFFQFLKLKINFILIFLSVLSLFLIPFFLQIYLGETDHSTRMGMLEIDIKDKIYLNNFFFKSIIRIEPILIFLVSLFITVLMLIKFKKEKLFNKVNIFFYLYIASLATPFLFITFSSKVIAMYHFADYILVNGLLYIIIVFVSILNLYLKNFNMSNIFKTLFFLFILSLFSINNYLNIKDNNDREHVNKFIQIILDKKARNTKINLFTNDMFFAHAWLFNNNSNLIISDGFTNALRDETIMLNLIKGLKLIGFNSNEFQQIINFEGNTHLGRNPITTYLFNYKYQANKFRKFSGEEQFTTSQNNLIKTISPLRVMINIVPKDQKEQMFRKFNQQKNEKNDFGKFFVVLNTNLIPAILIDKNYKNFKVLYKKDNILILRKI